MIDFNTVDFSNVSELFVAGKEAHNLYINGSKVWEKGGSTSPFLTFTAKEANSEWSINLAGLEYSTDGGVNWSDYPRNIRMTLANVGDKVGIRTKSDRNDIGYTFYLSGRIAASGNIMSLLKNDGDLDTIPSNYCFTKLFQDCTALTSAPELPATTLANNCYQFMFDGCTSLVNPPSELPALSVPYAAYGDMFAGTAITKSPYIRAKYVNEQWSMASMFKNCSQLEEIKMDYTGYFSGNTKFQTWVEGVASSGTFYYNGFDTTRGTSAIPTGWTVQSF